MKTKVSIPIIVASVFFLIVVVAVIARTSFAPPAQPDLKMSASQAADNAWLNQKAKDCSGNFDSLAAPDKQKAQQLTKGKGAFVISVIYRNSK